MKYLFFNTKKKNEGNNFSILLVLSLGFLLLMSVGINNVATINSPLMNPAVNQTLTSNTWQNTASPSGNYTIDYDDDNITAAAVADLGTVLEDAYDWLVNNWDLPDPFTGSHEPPIEVTVVHNSGYNGKAIADLGSPFDNKFSMEFWPAYLNQGFPLDHEPIKVVGHEHLHLCQYVHPDYPPADWVLEGQARMSQDKFSNWLDDADGTEAGSSYLLQSGNYIGGSHRNDLTSLSYDACFFWNYLLEQFGDDKVDPAYGYDFITTFWDTSVNPSSTDGVTMLRNALSADGDGRSLEETFSDFSVMLYTKDLDPTTTPSKWEIVDDDSGTGANYDQVSTEISTTLFSGSSISNNNEEISRWASKFYEVDIDPAVEVITIQFNQTTNNELFYALLAVDASDDLEYYYTTTGKNLQRAIVNNNYDRVVVVVVGLENTVVDPAEFDYAIEAGTPDLYIKSPRNSPETAWARVGPYDTPEKFISIVDINYRKTAPVHGFTTENFNAYVGGINAPVLSATDVFGLYFLEIQAPTQAANGLYQLEVELVDSDGNVIDDASDEPSVYYNDTYYDLALCIDKSGSMGTNDKYLAARSAAKLFTNTFLSDDQLAIVEFDTSANTIHELMKLTKSNRNTALGKIDTITPGGATSVGDGLFHAQEQFAKYGIEDYPKHIILLSDGKENTAPYINTILPLLQNNGTIVHVITIGSDAAYEDMQELAGDTGGTYFYAFDPASGDIPNDLAQIYRSITENIRNIERFYHARGSIAPGNSKIFNLEVTDSMDYVEFTIHHNASTAPTISVSSPTAGISYTWKQDDSGMGHEIYQINNPIIGTYTINISAGGGSDLLYFVEGAAHTTVTARLLSPPNGYVSEAWANGAIIGEPEPFRISLTDSKPIIHANVTLTVTPPGYKTYGDKFVFPLYDDGNHGDGLPEDGIFGCLDTATSENGSYQFLINVTGTSNDFGDFTRIRTGAFHRYIPREKTWDQDQDGLPDDWEKKYGLKANDNAGEHGGTGDPDKDGLENSGEFYWGTDPLNSDTDFGGEGDGSEINFDRNPHDPTDDQILKFPTIRVYPGNQQVSFRLPNIPNYTTANLKIYRSTSPVFNLGTPVFDSIYQTTWSDSPLVNYQTYYYRFMVILSGTATGLTREYEVIPKLNVIKPEAGIVLDGGNKTTETNLVTVNIYTFQNDHINRSANDPSFMRISEDPDELEDLSWIPFLPEFPRVLSSGAGVKSLYVQISDNQTIPEVSPVMTAGIYYTGADDVGPETAVTFFLIIVNLITIAVVYFRKKRKKFPNYL